MIKICSCPIRLSDCLTISISGRNQWILHRNSYQEKILRLLLVWSSVPSKWKHSIQKCQKSFFCNFVNVISHQNHSRIGPVFSLWLQFSVMMKYLYWLALIYFIPPLPPQYNEIIYQREIEESSNSVFLFNLSWAKIVFVKKNIPFTT